jgi:hypothetical protein
VSSTVGHSFLIVSLRQTSSCSVAAQLRRPHINAARESTTVSSFPSAFAIPHSEIFIWLGAFEQCPYPTPTCCSGSVTSLEAYGIDLTSTRIGLHFIGSLPSRFFYTLTKSLFQALLIRLRSTFLPSTISVLSGPPSHTCLFVVHHQCSAVVVTF